MVATAQFDIPVKTRPPIFIPARSVPALTAAESAANITVRGRGLALSFDRVRGVIDSFECGGKNMLCPGPRLNFWRAPTDNDSGGGRGKRAGEWYAAGLHWLQHRTDSVSVTPLAHHAVRIDVVSRIAPPVHAHGFLCRYTYVIHGNGWLDMHLRAAPEGKWPCPSLPRIGLQMAIPSALDQIQWFGRGPGESYSDSCEATRIDLFKTSVDGLLTPYVKPQENGNRMDVRWLTLRNRQGAGWMAVGRPTINFSAHRFTTNDFTQTRNHADLVPRDFITLNLDHRQRGLGSASCGPDVLPPYDLKPEPFAFSVRLIPLKSLRDNPLELVKLDIRG